MRLRPVHFQAGSRFRLLDRPPWSLRRCLMTLAIETSCDDTSVAVVEKGTQNGRVVARLHFHKKVTSNNSEYQGVHPLVSLQSHQQNLANLVGEAIESLPLQHEGLARAQLACTTSRRLPDFISITRGPGMRSNLFTGLDTAKGLAVAWQVLHVFRLSTYPVNFLLETSCWSPSYAGACSDTTAGGCSRFLSQPW